MKRVLITTIRFSCSKSISCFRLQILLEGSKGSALWKSSNSSLQLILVKEHLSASLCYLRWKESFSFVLSLNNRTWMGRQRSFSLDYVSLCGLKWKCSNKIIKVAVKSYNLSKQCFCPPTLALWVAVASRFYWVCSGLYAVCGRNAPYCCRTVLKAITAPVIGW